MSPEIIGVAFATPLTIYCFYLWGYWLGWRDAVSWVREERMQDEMDAGNFFADAAGHLRKPIKRSKYWEYCITCSRAVKKLELCKKEHV